MPMPSARPKFFWLAKIKFWLAKKNFGWPKKSQSYTKMKVQKIFAIQNFFGPPKNIFSQADGMHMSQNLLLV